MNDTVGFGSLALQLVAGHPLGCLTRPIGADVRKDLRTVGQQTHHQHTHTVENVVFGRQRIRLTGALIIEGGAEQRFRIVAVRPVVGPLTLTLEAAGDRVMTNLLFLEFIGQIGVACHQILDDAIHLDGELPLLLFLLGSELDTHLFAEEVHLVGVVVATLFAMRFGPRKRLLELFLVVDALFHTAQNLDLVNRFDAHTEVLFHHALVHNGAGNAHALRADLQVGLATHGGNRHSGTAKAQQLLLHVLGHLGDLVTVLHLVAVNAKGRQTLLGVAGQHGRQIHRTGTFGTVEAPNTLDGVGIHIHRFGAVAPARGNRQGDGNALFLKFVSTSRRFRHATDAGVSHHDLHRFTVGIEQVLLEQFLCRFSHRPNQRLQRFTHHLRTATTVYDGTDTDHRILADVSVFCHNSQPPMKY